jgi:hypothetical protein
MADQNVSKLGIASAVLKAGMFLHGRSRSPVTNEPQWVQRLDVSSRRHSKGPMAPTHTSRMSCSPCSVPNWAIWTLPRTDT